MATGWRRFDTLALRLFLLMWVVLLASHFISFRASVPLTAGGPPPERMQPGPPPPSGPGAAGGPGGPGGPREPHGRPPADPPPLRAIPPAELPARTQTVDYALRALVIALGAAAGAAWVARPLRRLSRAAEALSQRLARQQPLPALDESRGTAEVRRSAAVFNQMAQRLQSQFDARGLHLAAVSHDLRTPLTRLRMRLEDAPPALAEAAAADIREMVEMIDTTLAVLREQRDGGPPGTLLLRSLVEALADDLAAAGQPVTLEPGPEHRVHARPAALRRIVGNLAGNALRHGGSATLSLEPDDGGVCLHVDDRGPGIPPERLAEVMQPWVRLGPGGGHGLGLSIARDLAERDGARLTLANRAGGGLRATLWLPTEPIVSAPTPSA